MALICVLFIFIRVYNLPDWLTASSDQGMHMLAIYDIVANHHPTLLGPPSSFAILGGRMFFFGPLIFYLPIPVVLLFGWNVLYFSYYFILVQFLAFLFCLRETIKSYSFRTGVTFGIVFALFPMMVQYSRFFWNSNLMIPITLILIGLHLLHNRTTTGKKYIVVLLIGTMWGLGMQSHYSYVLAMIISLLWLGNNLWMRPLNILLLIVGFVIGFAPLIIFDAKHQFYNLKTIYLYVSLSKGSGKSELGSFLFNFDRIHYLLSIITLAVWAVPVWLSKQKDFVKQLSPAIVGIFAFFCLTNLLVKPNQGFLMTKGFNYPLYQKMEKIILSRKPRNYNVLDMATGDTRAMYLRAILTLSGHPPMGVADYPITEKNYIYSRLPIEKIIGHGPWEESAMTPSVVSGKWQIDNGIYLYELSRIKPQNNPEENK